MPHLDSQDVLYQLAAQAPLVAVILYALDRIAGRVLDTFDRLIREVLTCRSSMKREPPERQ